MLDMLARVNLVCLPALSRFDRRVLALLDVRVDCAVLRCAVLSLWCGSRYLMTLDDNMLVYNIRRTYIKKRPIKNKKTGKEGSSSKTERKKKGNGPFRQEIEEGIVQAGDLRGQEGANGAR